MFRAANAKEEWGLILISAFSLLWMSLCVTAVIFVLSTEQAENCLQTCSFHACFSQRTLPMLYIVVTSQISMNLNVLGLMIGEKEEAIFKCFLADVRPIFFF